MKGARRTRKSSPRGGFADLMAPPSTSNIPAGVITGLARAPPVSPTRSVTSPQRPPSAPNTDDWDSLRTVQPKRRLSPHRPTLPTSHTSPSLPLAALPHPHPAPPHPPPPQQQHQPVRHIPTSYSHAQFPVSAAPPTHAAPAAVPSFLSGWEGADGWGDDPELDDSDPDDDSWAAWDVPDVTAAASQTPAPPQAPSASVEQPPDPPAPPANRDQSSELRGNDAPESSAAPEHASIAVPSASLEDPAQALSAEPSEPEQPPLPPAQPPSFPSDEPAENTTPESENTQPQDEHESAFGAQLADPFAAEASNATDAFDVASQDAFATNSDPQPASVPPTDASRDLPVQRDLQPEFRATSNKDGEAQESESTLLTGIPEGRDAINSDAPKNSEGEESTHAEPIPTNDNEESIDVPQQAVPESATPESSTAPTLHSDGPEAPLGPVADSTTVEHHDYKGDVHVAAAEAKEQVAPWASSESQPIPSNQPTQNAERAAIAVNEWDKVNTESGADNFGWDDWNDFEETSKPEPKQADISEGPPTDQPFSDFGQELPANDGEPQQDACAIEAQSDVQPFSCFGQELPAKEDEPQDACANEAPSDANGTLEVGVMEVQNKTLTAQEQSAPTLPDLKTGDSKSNAWDVPVDQGLTWEESAYPSQSESAAEGTDVVNPEQASSAEAGDDGCRSEQQAKAMPTAYVAARASSAAVEHPVEEMSDHSTNLSLDQPEPREDAANVLNSSTLQAHGVPPNERSSFDVGVYSQPHESNFNSDSVTNAPPNLDSSSNRGGAAELFSQEQNGDAKLSSNEQTTDGFANSWNPDGFGMEPTQQKVDEKPSTGNERACDDFSVVWNPPTDSGQHQQQQQESYNGLSSENEKVDDAFGGSWDPAPLQESSTAFPSGESAQVMQRREETLPPVQAMETKDTEHSNVSLVKTPVKAGYSDFEQSSHPEKVIPENVAQPAELTDHANGVNSFWAAKLDETAASNSLERPGGGAESTESNKEAGNVDQKPMTSEWNNVDKSTAEELPLHVVSKKDTPQGWDPEAFSTNPSDENMNQVGDFPVPPQQNRASDASWFDVQNDQPHQPQPSAEEPHAYSFDGAVSDAFDAGGKPPPPPYPDVPVDTRADRTMQPFLPKPIEHQPSGAAPRAVAKQSVEEQFAHSTFSPSPALVQHAPPIPPPQSGAALESQMHPVPKPSDTAEHPVVAEPRQQTQRPVSGSMHMNSQGAESTLPSNWSKDDGLTPGRMYHEPTNVGSVDKRHPKSVPMQPNSSQPKSMYAPVTWPPQRSEPSESTATEQSKEVKTAVDRGTGDQADNVQNNAFGPNVPFPNRTDQQQEPGFGQLSNGMAGDHQYTEMHIPQVPVQPSVNFQPPPSSGSMGSHPYGNMQPQVASGGAPTHDAQGNANHFAPVRPARQASVFSEHPTGDFTKGSEPLGEKGSANRTSAVDPLYKAVPEVSYSFPSTSHGNPTEVAPPSQENTASSGFPPYPSAQKPSEVPPPVPESTISSAFPAYPSVSKPPEVPAPVSRSNVSSAFPAYPNAPPFSAAPYVPVQEFTGPEVPAPYSFSLLDTASSVESDRRPARPLMTWGFGGSIVTLFPSNNITDEDTRPRDQQKASVSVYHMNQLIQDVSSEDVDAISEAGPPMSLPVRPPDLLSYAEMCDRLSSRPSLGESGHDESRRCLWRLLSLMCRECNTAWRGSASTALTGSSVPLYSTFRQTSQLSQVSEVQVEKRSGDVAEIERLVLSGKVSEAVNLAQSLQLWSIALALCGTVDEKLRDTVMSNFAKSSLPDGCALQTLCFSMAHNESEIVERGCSPSGLSQWRKNVSVLLRGSCNQVGEVSPQASNSINRIGAALAETKRDFLASHICSLLSGELQTLSSDGALLLGVPGSAEKGRARSLASTASILQSVVLEAVGTAQGKHPLPHLLPFRLILAEELAAFGKHQVAMAHCDAIISQVRSIVNTGDRVAVLKLLTRPFLSHLESVDSQLRGYLEVQQTEANKGLFESLKGSLSSMSTTSNSVSVEKQVSAPVADHSSAQLRHPESPQPPQPLTLNAASRTPEVPPLQPVPQVQAQHVQHAQHIQHMPNISNYHQQMSYQPANPGISAGPVPPNAGGGQTSPRQNTGWDAIVSRTIKVLAPADGDLSPPPRGHVRQPFHSHGQPAPLGLGASTGMREPGREYSYAYNQAMPNGPPPSSNDGTFVGNGANPSQFGADSSQLQHAAGVLPPTQKAETSQQSVSNATNQSQTSEKKPPRPPKKEPADPKEDSKQNKQGKGSSIWRFRFREKLAGVFGGPPRAHLGEENKFVYDKARGRYVIDGETPEEDDDVPPPPPDDDSLFNQRPGEEPHLASSISYDDGLNSRAPNVYRPPAQAPGMLRSQSVEENIPGHNPAGEYPAPPSHNPSMENLASRDTGSETASIGSTASAPVPSYRNQYRAGTGRLSGKRAYVDTFNPGKAHARHAPSALGPAMPQPARPLQPGAGANGNRPGAFQIFTPNVPRADPAEVRSSEAQPRAAAPNEAQQRQMQSIETSSTGAHGVGPNSMPSSPGMPPLGMPSQGMPSQGMAVDGMAPPGMPPPSMPPPGMPSPGMPPPGMPSPGIPSPGMYSHGVPTGMPTGMPIGMPTGMPSHGMSTGMPSHGMSTGMPSHGMPSNGMPPHGTATQSNWSGQTSSASSVVETSSPRARAQRFPKMMA